jgi:hypothetical protein
MTPCRSQDRGPFHAEQMRAGGPGERSHAHPFRWAPTGTRQDEAHREHGVFGVEGAHGRRRAPAAVTVEEVFG